MGNCKTCRFWAVKEASTFGKCERFKTAHQEASEQEVVVLGDAMTGPEFGCILWTSIVTMVT